MLGSLRLRLVAWLLLPLSIFVVVCGYLSWRHAASVADYVQDHELLSSAKLLSDRLSIRDGNAIQASVPPSALSPLVLATGDRMFLSVLDAGGRLLAGSPDLPLPAVPKPPAGDEARWYDTSFDGLSLRAVAIRRPIHEEGGARDATIVVARTTLGRDRMLEEIWRPTMLYLVIALGLALALAAAALTWELRHLTRLSDQLLQTDPLHLDFVVDGRRLHAELRPVADTINRFARQLRAHSQAQRRFIADASHQLRTPLALQASQIEFARHVLEHGNAQAARDAEMDSLWLAMQQSNRRLIGITDKLLLLAQAEHADARNRLERVDLAAVALRCVEQLAALADRRDIDLGIEGLAGAAEPAWIQAQPTLLEALLTNLLDNALRYTQEAGRVTLGVHRIADAIELCVDDNGPGIPAEARDRVFERFYRVSHQSEGTGLGLAIVKEAASAFGATVRLAANPNETQGLRVCVRFAAAD